MPQAELPAVALAAVPGRRRATLELAGELERRGFAGAFCASFGDAVGLCEALALTTRTLRFGTAIANLYTRHASDYAITTSLIHELSGGRFHFGVGVSHEAMNRRLGIAMGKPLDDVRAFVEAWRGTPRAGEQPPLVLAGLRRRMIALAGELAEGVVFANVARSFVPRSLEALPAAKRADPDFFVGNMLPVCISDDRAAAAAVSRRTLQTYVRLPSYRSYWKEAGYREEMEAIEAALARRDAEAIDGLMSDRWLADCTLHGSVGQVREGVDAWREAGVRTPILVPSSAVGNQLVAFQELFAAYA